MIQKLLRLGIRLGIKESYLLARNTYGLGFHPYKTLRSIFREKDRSQEILVFGLPAYVLVVGAGLVWTGRRVFGMGGEWGWGAKTTAIFFLSVSFLIVLYIAYWWVKILVKKY